MSVTVARANDRRRRRAEIGIEGDSARGQANHEVEDQDFFPAVVGPSRGRILATITVTITNFIATVRTEPPVPRAPRFVLVPEIEELVFGSRSCQGRG